MSLKEYVSLSLCLKNMLLTLHVTLLLCLKEYVIMSKENKGLKHEK